MEPLTAGDPQTIGDFRLRARLGAGGMGRVYLATSPAKRLVAVKVIHPELWDNQDFVRRFRGEADAAQRVSGAYTAPVVAAGVDDRPPWLATAFVPGPPLDSISRYGPLPLSALWRLGAGWPKPCARSTPWGWSGDLRPATSSWRRTGRG